MAIDDADIDDVEDIEVDNVGDYFIDKERTLWQMVAFIGQPSVIFKNCLTGDEIHCGIGSPLAKTFTRLIPQTKEQDARKNNLDKP